MTSGSQEPGGELAARGGGIRPRRPGAWLNCSIFFADIAGFGDPVRDDHDRGRVRQVMYGLLRDAFAHSGVPWSACLHEDRGDGVIIIVPPDIPTLAVVDPLIARLAAALRRHNRGAGPPLRLQLRAALHVGPVVPEPAGPSGESIIVAARLLDAPVLKESLAAIGADLGLIASSFVYETVVKHGPGQVDPAAYRPVEVRVKESTLPAWMFLAGGARAAPPGPARAAGPPAGTSFNAEVHIAGDLVLGNKITYPADPG